MRARYFSEKGYDKALAAIFVVAGVVALWLLLTGIVRAYQHGMSGDGWMFLILGRGMLNGLTSYRELFDSKAPGIHFLAAISLWLTGNEKPAQIMQIAALLSVPASLTAYGFHIGRQLTRRQGLTITLSSFVFGTILYTFLYLQAGSFRPESFAAVFGSLYLVAFAGVSDAWSWKRLLLLSTFLAGTIGFREPVFIAVVGGVLLLCRKPSQLISGFAVPLAIALGAGALFLWYFGILESYINFYLPDTFANRVSNLEAYSHDPTWFYAPSFLFAHPIPIWPRVAAFTMLFKGFPYSSVPLLLPLLVLLWCINPILRTPQGQKRMAMWTMFSVLSAGLFLFSLRSAMALLYYYKDWTSVLLLLVVEVTLCVFIGVLLLALLSTLPDRGRRLLFYAFSAAASLYFCTLSVGIAGYIDPYFAQGVPFYVALFLVFVASMGESFPSRLGRVTFAAVSLLLISALLHTAIHLPVPPMHDEKQLAKVRRTARTLDQLMDACGYSRYLGVSGHIWAVQSLMKHSPLGPAFYQYRIEKDDNLVYWQGFYDSLHTAPLIVMAPLSQQRYRYPGKENVQEIKDMWKEIRTKFTRNPPACARPYLQLGGETLFFRKESAGES